MKIPKLFIDVQAGLAMGDEERAFVRTLPPQTEVTVRGLHFAQEDSADEIGAALAESSTAYEPSISFAAGGGPAPRRSLAVAPEARSLDRQGCLTSTARV